MKQKLTVFIAIRLLGAPTVIAHEHVAAGATEATPGSPLIFASEDDFGAETGFVFPLLFSATGAYAGYYHGKITIVSLPATPDFGGPDPEHAALGSHLEAIVESVEGPIGGSFGFWESPGEEMDATELTINFPVGLVSGTYHFPISENSGEPGADPYGHIHGRVYSATRPGLYHVGFRFVDTATNGPNGGPIHPPSEPFHLYFQAGITIAEISNQPDGMQLTFATFSGGTYQVETTSTPTDPATWRAIGEALVGDDHLHTMNVPPGEGAAFFRLSVR